MYKLREIKARLAGTTAFASVSVVASKKNPLIHAVVFHCLPSDEHGIKEHVVPFLPTHVKYSIIHVGPISASVIALRNLAQAFINVLLRRDK